VAQPFHIYGSSGGGRSFGRRPIVLARLPHVDIAERPTAPAAGFAPVESQPRAFSQGTRFYLDAQHASSPVREAAPVRRPEPELPSTSHRRRHASHRQPRSDEASAARGQQNGVGTGRFDLPGKLASYSGLIVTLALAASAALLYWMIIVPSQMPVEDFGNGYDAYGATKIEIPQFEFHSAPPTAPKTASPVATVDPFLSARPGQSNGEPAAIVAQQSPAWSDAPPAAADSQTTSETPAPPAEPTPELIPLPTENNEPEQSFNDASAAYPTTDHPLAWDLSKLGVVEVAADDGAAVFSAPEMAQQPAPTTNLR